MSKRAREEEDSADSAKRARYTDSGLLRVLEISGLNEEFLLLLDRVSQRAVCCICRESTASIKTISRIPQAWPYQYQNNILLQQKPYWDRQLMVALAYDHLGRFLSIYLNTDFGYIPRTKSIVNVAIERNAIAIALWFSQKLHAVDFFAIDLEFATVEMYRALRTFADAPSNHIYAHLLLAEQRKWMDSRGHLLREPTATPRSFAMESGFGPGHKEPHHFDYLAPKDTDSLFID